MAPKIPNQQYPLYNTTFSLYRVSPLYTGSYFSLNNATLSRHARQFRDILAGEVLRGVRVGLGPDDNVLARAGALQTVTWKLLPEEEAWAAEEETYSGNEDTTTSLAINRGMLLTVTYEKMAYRAILLRARREGNFDETVDSAKDDDDDGFKHFPLLLSKMPGPLRETFADYLCTTFDSRVSPLRLSSAYLTNTFEKYLADISIGEDGEALDVAERSRSLRNFIKETAVYLGVNLPDGSVSLKGIDIQIAREDLPKIITKGKQLARTGGDNPFLNALTTYIKAHLALNIADERIKIIRIACGAFVLGGEGRVKITQPLSTAGGDRPQSRATRRLVNDFISVASGGALSRDEGIP